MKTLWITLIYKIARQYFDQDLFTRVEALVKAMGQTDLSGDEKRAKVREAVKAEWTDIRTIVIDTIIQIVLIQSVK